MDIGIARELASRVKVPIIGFLVGSGFPQGGNFSIRGNKSASIFIQARYTDAYTNARTLASDTQRTNNGVDLSFV